MKISIVLRDKSVITTKTDKTFYDLSLELCSDYIVTNDGVIKSSEIVLIQKVEEKSLDLKVISTEDLVNELVSRSMTHEERYHMQRLLQPSELCGNNIPRLGVGR